VNLLILYDNTAHRAGLRRGNGFACLLQRPRHPAMLFDTGERADILRANMDRLGVDPRSIGAVFLSHWHSDHTHGLSALLDAGVAPIIYAPPSFRAAPAGRDVLRRVPPNRIVYADRACELERGLFSTGELGGLEHALVVATPAGMVVLTGCSHPGVPVVMAAAGQFGSIRGLVGGLHGFQEHRSLAHLQFVCPCHCSTDRPWRLNRFPANYIPGGVGRMIKV